MGPYLESRQHFDPSKPAKGKLYGVRKAVMLTKIFQSYVRPKYEDSQAKYFARWKGIVLQFQKFELTQLDLQKDLLVDELQQSMQINEVLRDEEKMEKLLQIRCADCINATLRK